MNLISFQVAMCHFRTIKDAADVAIATMLSGVQVRSIIKIFVYLMPHYCFFVSLQ